MLNIVVNSRLWLVYEVLTYQMSQNVDLVKEHFLLIFVHMTLSEDLDSSLSASLSVYTHSNFSEGT